MSRAVRDLDPGELSEAIHQYFEGQEKPLRQIVRDSPNIVSGEVGLLKTHFFDYFNPKGPLKKSIVSALPDGRVEEKYRPTLNAIGACYQDGRLTRAGKDKAITLVSPVKEQIAAFNSCAECDRSVFYQEAKWILNEKVEVEHLKRLSEQGYFVVPHSSNVLTMVAVTFATIALERMCVRYGESNVVGKNGLWLHSDFEEHPPCVEVIECGFAEGPERLVKAWKGFALHAIGNIDLKYFEKRFIEVAEKTSWVYSRNHPVDKHVEEVCQLVRSVNTSFFRRFVYEKLKGGINTIGWPDLTVFSENGAWLIELKKDSDRLHISQVRTIQLILERMPSVNNVKVLRHFDRV